MYEVCLVLTGVVAVMTVVEATMFAGGVTTPTVIRHNGVFNWTANIQSLFNAN